LVERRLGESAVPSTLTRRPSTPVWVEHIKITDAELAAAPLHIHDGQG